jgi:hypothetical protein
MPTSIIESGIGVIAVVEFGISRIRRQGEIGPRARCGFWIALLVSCIGVFGHAADFSTPQPSTSQVPRDEEGKTASLAPNSPPNYDGILEDTLLPNNPHAIDHCLAKVRVTSARLRESPSLGAAIIGSRQIDQPVFVEEVLGKWARIQLEDGTSAYIATYLLAFSWQDLLDQWKKGAPKPTVGKKAKVKWAKVLLRAYPNARSDRLGELRRHDMVAVLGETHPGWTFVQVNGAYGFIATRNLSSLNRMPPGFAAAPLADLQKGRVEAVLPRLETPVEYVARTAWSPELFQATWPKQRLQAVAAAKRSWDALEGLEMRPSGVEPRVALQ